LLATCVDSRSGAPDPMPSEATRQNQTTRMKNSLSETTKMTVKNFFDPVVIKPGDVIGFSGVGMTGDIINIGTWGIPRWNLCHVGIIGEAQDDKLLLFESTTLDDLPCEISGEKFNGTQAHSLATVCKGYGGKVWHYPLYRPLYDFERKRLTEFLMGTIHVPYDKMKALRATDLLGVSLLESCLRETDLHQIFCSDWVAAAHAYIGLWPTTNSGAWNPNKLVRYLRSKGILCKPRRLNP